MIKFNLQLLPVNSAESPEISKSNTLAEHSYNHLKTLIGDLKCKKHPSFKNVVNIIAAEGKDPKVEIANVCCQDFFNAIGKR